MADRAMQPDGQESLSRRRYVQAIVAASATGVAGCNQGDSSDPTNGTNNGSDADDVNSSNETETTTSQGPPVSETITVSINNTAASSNLNQWATSGNSTGAPWIRELVDPRLITEANEVLLDEHEFDAPWIAGTDTISVPSVSLNFRTEAPYDRYWEMNPEMTYWDGTPINAPAKVNDDRLYFYTDQQKFAPAATFNGEAISEFEYHWWRDKGEVEGQDPNPTSKQVLSTDIPGRPPFHPDFTEPYVQKFKDAANEDEVDSIISDIEGDNVSYGRIADEGWASGPYRVESSDDVSAERMSATLRDDHPNEHIAIPNLELRFASPDRRQVLKSQGVLDVGRGAVLEDSGNTNREMLPDYSQEIDRYLQTGNDLVLFNWHNKHLARIGVRQAIIAAVDWETAAVNGWGAGRTLPQKDHTGILQTTSGSFFSEDFLDTLYEWPMKADPELASRLMERAGYTKENGIWTDWEGDAVDLNYISSGNPDWAGFSQSLQQMLQDFGFKFSFNAMEGTAWIEALKGENLNYDMAIEWGPAATDPFHAYWSEGAGWRELLIGGDSNDPVVTSPVDPETTGPETTHDTVDAQGKPLEVRIPDDPQDIDMWPERAGANPDLPEGQSTAIDLADLVHSFRDPEISEEQYRKNAQLCARYYNFYLPDFKFHQYTWGVWGNVRDFNFAPKGHPANRTYHEVSGFTDAFQVLAGIMQPKYDQEYEPPS